MFEVSTNKDALDTGTRDVSELVGGEILPGALMVIIGESGTGKSIFCQHLASSALSAREASVAYFTAHPNFTDLLAQMDAFSLDVRHHFVTDRFRVCPLNSFNIYADTEKATRFMVEWIEELPPRFNLIIVDALTPFIDKVPCVKKFDILQSFRQLLTNSRSILLVIDSYALEKELLPRVFMMADYYIRMKNDAMKLGNETLDKRSIKILDVRKIRGADVMGDKSIKFEIRPGAGIQVLPFVKVRV